MNATFTTQIIPDEFHNFEVNKDALLTDVIKQVLRAIAPEGQGANISEYRILITYQLTVSDSSIGELSAEQKVLSEQVQLQDIKLTDGFSILFVKPVLMTSKLELWIQNKKVATLDRHETLLGRSDIEKGIRPDFDLTPYLGQYELKVSRKQAHIMMKDGKWKIRISSEAQSTIFLNEQRLEHGSSYEITHESVLCFGPNPEQPYLRIITRINSD